MTFGENLRLALAGLWANKMRALLTLLGIIIGIASVMTILTISSGITNSVTKSLSGLGGQDLYLMVDTKDNIAMMTQVEEPNASSEPTDYEEEEEDETSGNPWDEISDSDYMNPDFLNQMRADFSGEIEGIAIMEGGASGSATASGKDIEVGSWAGNQDFLIGSNREIMAGRTFTPEEADDGDQVAVISEHMAKALFPGEPDGAIGKNFDYSTDATDMSFKIVGVYKEIQTQGVTAAILGGGGTDSEDNFVFPYPLAEDLNGYPSMGIMYVIMRPAPGTNVEDFQPRLQAYLDDHWAGSQYGVMIQSMKQAMDAIKGVFKALSMGLSVIAGLSLLVGGIGVMNIMLVSVTERTREIGIRKALGATRGNIRTQFLIEAMMVCLLGGLLGVILGGLAGFIGGKAMSVEAYPPFGAVLFALAFSVGIGVFFGYYPASKAAKLDPIEALRFE